MPRGRDQDATLRQNTPETIDHYAGLLENRKYEFTDLGLGINISRKEGLVYYAGRNGLRSYPLDHTGYRDICRALVQVRAYRRKKEKSKPTV